MTSKRFTGFLWCVLLSILTTGSLHAQIGIANYTFSQSIGSSFPTFTGGTVVFSGSYHDTVSNAINLGGTFIFGGVSYTQCYISSNGFITFGAAPSRTNWEPLSTLNSTTGAIAAFGASGDGSAAPGASPQISYGNAGTDFVVQYLDHSTRLGLNSDKVNFQIRLNLTANTVSLVYGNFTAPSSNNAVQVGIRGASTDWVTNVNNLLVSTRPFGNTCTWANAVSGNASDSRMSYNVLSFNIVPPLNLTYTWAPAVAPAPIRTFYAVSNITGHAATIKWAPATGATQYNVRYRIAGACSWMTPGISTVSDTTATLTGLSAETAYHVSVQSVSSSGTSIWSHIPSGTGGTGTDGYTLGQTFTTIVTCAAPTAIFIAPTTTSASISFTSTGSSIIAEYGPVGFTPGMGTLAGTDGTIVTGTSSPLLLSGLSFGTNYDVYVRQNCIAAGEGFSTNSKVPFVTLCNPASDFFENFNTSNSLPACFRKVGIGGTVSLISGSPTISATLYIAASGNTPAVVALPPVANAGAGTHRLRFNVRANFNGSDTLQLGYLTNINDATSFVSIRQFTSLSISYTEYTVLPGTAPGGSQFLAFRQKGYLGNGMQIDDIYWEIIPGCTAPTFVKVGAVTNNSASVSFTATGGSNYVVEYGASGFIPGTGNTAGAGGTIATGTGSPIAFSGLSAATTYDVYVRQACALPASGYSNNSVTATFLTICNPVTSFSENFDVSTGLPLCFRKVGTGGYISLTNNASSAPRALYLESSINGLFGSSLALVALPPVSNAGAGTHWLRFKLKDTSIYNADTLQVGYLTNVNDSLSFVELRRFTAPLTSAYIDHAVIPGATPGSSQHFAFRVKGASRGDWLIDDILWEAIPACRAPDTPRINTIAATSASVNFMPTPGSSSGSYIAEYGFAGFTPGSGATAGTGGTIVTGAGSPIILNGISPGIVYDVYVRQNCTASGNGYSLNSAKATFNTLCSPVTSFYENFDAGTSLPVCFKKVGTAGSVSVGSSTVSAPYALYMKSIAANSLAVVALPWISNAGAGTHQLRFKLKGIFPYNDTLQVGYLTNIADPSSFVTLDQFLTTAAIVEQKVRPGTAPGSNQYLAFRTKSVIIPNYAGLTIDDIYWEPLPACPEPMSVSVSAVTNNAASVSFTAPGSSSFIVEYGPPGFIPGTSTTAGTNGTIVAGNNSPITLSGLTPSTTYQIYVRQNCTAAGNGYSVNSIVTSFTTAIACAVPAAISFSGITTTSASVNFFAMGSSFIVEYGPAGFTPGTGAAAGTGGTIVTGTSSPITLNSLGIANTYDVYVRQNCTGQGYGYSANAAKRVLTTTCVPVTTYSQNFDAGTSLPACFRKVGTSGTVSINSSSASSLPNALFINSGSVNSQAVVALPPVSNAGAGTHQLRFKLRADYLVDSLEIGYLTNVADSSTFVVLNRFLSPSYYSPFEEFIVLPGTAPGANQHLAFREKGISSYGLLIDDISWEPAPLCLIPVNVNISAVTANSAAVSFTSAGSSFVVEYGPTGFTPGTAATAGVGGMVVTNTNSLTMLTTLNAGTIYDVYVRQNCTAMGNGYSTNSVKATFTTLCNPVTNFFEGFDSNSNLLNCFRRVGNGGFITIFTPSGTSTRNEMYISSTSTSQGIIALPPVSNAGSGTHRLRFKARGEQLISDTLQVGYLTNIADPSTFVLLSQAGSFTAGAYTESIVVPGTAPGPNQYLAFRAKGSTTNAIVIDDIYWENIPTCSAPSSIGISSLTINSASVSFASTGSNFIVEYGIKGFIPGQTATAGVGGTVISAISSPVTLTGLNGGTSYDVYVRQICTPAVNNYSINALRTSFTTYCNPATSFFENFDASTSLPGCLRRVGTGGNVAVTSSYAGSSLPNVLNIRSVSMDPRYQAIVALPPVSNAGAGTHQLRFKMRHVGASDTLQIGYLTNILDSASFVIISQIKSTMVYTEYLVYPGTAPGSNQYLAIRGKGTANADILIDDIYWEALPACPAPISVSVSSTTNSASVSFNSAVGNNFVVEYGATGFTPGAGATAGTGGTIVTSTGSPVLLTGLTPSTAYQVYVRQNCIASGNGYSANSLVAPLNTLLVNDNAAGAIKLAVGAECSGIRYTNAGATRSTGEPYPLCKQTAITPVWFKFVAPASGAVQVSTKVDTLISLYQLSTALFSSTDSTNYSIFSVISCNDGNLVLNGSRKSVLYATGLTAGTTYYLAVDKYYSYGVESNFCITVSEFADTMLSLTNTCTSTYDMYNSSFCSSNYTGWVSLMDANSKLVALVRKPTGGNSGYFSVSQNVNTGAVRQANGTYYLDRNFRINYSSSDVTNVNVQLFFRSSELNTLATIDPAATLSNLGITRQKESPSGCYNNFNPANGLITFIPQTGNGNTGGVQWVSFTTPGFSNFYLNRAGTTLPISLEYFKGGKSGSTNTLSWKLTCTSASNTMVLERSSDGRRFDHNVTSITATAADCNQPFNAKDIVSLNGVNYYRLKMIDVDGLISYSSIVTIMNGGSGAELIGIYPTLVRNEALLSITASRVIQMQIRISDMSGRVIQTMSQPIAAGNSVVKITTSSLAAGTYNITALLDGIPTQTLRFVKQ